MQVWLVLPALHGETLSDIFSTFNIDFAKVAPDGNLLIFRVPIPWCNANKARHSAYWHKHASALANFISSASSLLFLFPSFSSPEKNLSSIPNSYSIYKNCYFLQWKLTSEIANELRGTWIALVDQLLRNVARRPETETAGLDWITVFSLCSWMNCVIAEQQQLSRGSRRV